MATVELIIGPMFSGKTTELLRRARALSAIGARVLFIAHSNDAQRYVQQPDLATAIDAAVRTHANDAQRGPNVHYATRLSEIDGLVSECDVVAVDEVQFFGDLIDFVRRHESRAGLTLLLSGLDGDADRRPFGQTLSVIPLCDEVVKLRAFDTVLRDGSRASFSLRLPDRGARGSDVVVEVGGSELYAAVSRKTYLQYTNDAMIDKTHASAIASESASELDARA
jgi:thymidine kinase